MASAASSNSVAIYNSAQLIPPILSLIELTLELPSMREAIDEGSKEAREVTRKSREAKQVEAERWDAAKKVQERSKDKATVSLNHFVGFVPPAHCPRSVPGLQAVTQRYCGGSGKLSSSRSMREHGSVCSPCH